MSNTPNRLYPTYTFQVNLPVGQAGSWSQPYITTNVPGSIDTTLAAAIPQQFSSFLANQFAGQPIIAEKQGFQFTVSGEQAVYLHNLYVSTPPAPSDLLILISSS